MVSASLWDVKMLQHTMPRFKGHPDALEIHMELFDKLLETRSMSLVTFHCLPPNCYHHCLALEDDVAARARDAANLHWTFLLEAEAAEREHPRP